MKINADLYAALAAPGGANDIAAYRKTRFIEMVQNLPIRKFVSGDNAYVCTETLLTPFSGKEKKILKGMHSTFT